MVLSIDVSSQADCQASIIELNKWLERSKIIAISTGTNPEAFVSLFYKPHYRL